MTHPNVALQQFDESPRRSPEVQAEIERIGSSTPYIETQRELDLHHYLDEHREAKVCARILSAEGAVLSQALQQYRMTHVKRRGVLQRIPMPVLYVKVQQYGRPMELLLAIAEAVGHDLRFGPLRDLRARVWGTLKAYGVELLLVDNADYLSLKALNELVEIFDNRQITVILAATYALEKTLGQPEYVRVYNSFLDFHDFRPLTRAEMASVIQVWEETVWRGTPLNLAQPGVAALLHERTEGLIDSLYATLRKIANARLDNQLSQIDPVTLSHFLSSRSKPKVRAK